MLKDKTKRKEKLIDQVKDPTGSTIYSSFKEPQGTFSMTVEKSGKFIYCFSNEMSSYARKVLSYVFPPFRLSPLVSSRHNSFLPLDKMRSKGKDRGINSLMDHYSVGWTNEPLHNSFHLHPPLRLYLYHLPSPLPPSPITPP